ncbi:hypothetical protein [Paenibacillus enshidis]
MTGVTGPTGPTVTANNLSAASTTIRSVPFLGVIPVSDVTSNGSAIKNNNGVITLAPNQTYSVNYNSVAFNSSIGTASAALALNGTALANIIPGTQSSQTGGAPNAQTNLSGGTIISTGGTSATVQLINSTIGFPSMNYQTTAVNVVKLA